MNYQPAAHHDGDDLRTPAMTALAAAYGLEDAQLTPLSARVHTTFRVDSPAAAGASRYVLRVYRPGSYSETAIGSELAWLKALRRDEGLLVPEPVATRDGSWVSRVPTRDGGEPRHAALLRWVPGRIPEAVPEAASYRRFGEFMARLHRHGSRFRVPADFERPHYDLDRLLGPPGVVIPHRVDSSLVSDDDRRMLSEAAAILRPAIESLGRNPEVFGLIHGDLQVSNQLLYEGEVGAIDFVDCGWGYHLYDIAGALLPAWEGSGSEERKEAFLRGYRRIRPLSRAHEALVEPMAVARGLSVMRWSLENWSDPAVREFGVTIVPHLKGQIERFLARRTAAPVADPGDEQPATTLQLLSQLRSRGIQLWEEDGRLRYKAPKRALTPQLRTQLAARKAEVLSALRAAVTAAEPTVPPITAVAREGALPASFAQQRMWILDQIDPGSPAYHIAQAIRLHGALRVDVLQRSLREIVRRHESLRTIFARVDGQPVQEITPAPALTVPMVDLLGLGATERAAAARCLAGEEALRSFDLERGPLARFTLLKLAKSEHWLLMTLHHIVSDGWSNGILIRELTALYRAYAAGKPSPLAELPIQYADFAHWQRRWLTGTVFNAQLAYWEKQLTGAPSHIALPLDRPRPRLQSDRGTELPLPFPHSLSQALEAFSQRREVTLFMTLLAALAALLYRHTGQGDVVVGSAIANRNRSEIEGLIGFFINTLVLRTPVSGDATFEQLVDTVRAVTLGAYSHQDLPFEMLVETLDVERNPSYTPVFQVLFVLQNAPRPAVRLPGLTLSMVDPPRSAAAFDLSLTVRQLPDGLNGALTYNTDLFDDTRICRMLQHFERLLPAAVASPGTRVGDLPLLSAAQRHQLLAEWNDRPTEPAGSSGIHQLFEAQAARTPEAWALVHEDRRLTYRELDARANQVAHFLLGQAVVPEELVAICLDRCIELIVSVLGVLKAGGAYVTLDPLYPPKRLAFMLEDTAARVLLTRRELLATLPECDARILCLDAEEENIAHHSAENPACRIASHQLAYVVYTSGSLGKPKGVMVSHHSFVGSYLAWEQEYRLRQWRGSHLQMGSPSFDLFCGDWVRALCSGGKLVLCPWGTLLEPERLYELMRREEVDCAEFVPAVMRGLLSYLDEAGQSLEFMRLIAVGSDTWYVSEYEHLKRFCSPETRLINSYGVAEGTVDNTYADRIAADLASEKTVPIGRPFGGNRIYLLDADLRPVPPGVLGELYVGGSTLARGYLVRPGMSAERFLPNPFSRQSGMRLYKTGDLARYLPDGNLDFLGRVDHQVKIRGFRIELGEVEAELASHPAVRDVTVLVHEYRPGDQRLIGYVVAESGSEPTSGELRDYVKESLPGYMVPAAVVFLEAIPLTPNGKVDHRALPAPDAAQLAVEDSYVAPETPTEELLAPIWSELLNVERVGIYDNFFDLGGHSLLATQLISRVRTKCQVELSLATFFEGPTVEDMAKSIDVARRIVAGPERARTSPDEEREEGEL